MKNLFNFVFSIYILFSCGTLHAQSYVWQIKGSSAEFWVMGVTHSLPKNEFKLPEKINEFYKQSARLIIEADIGNFSPIKTPSYKDYSSEETTAIVQQLLAQELMRPHLAEKITSTHPLWLVSLFKQALSDLKPEYLRINQLWEDGFDIQLYKRAKTENKSLAFMETMEQRDQAILSACTSQSEHMRMLKSLVKWLEESEHPLKLQMYTERLLMSGNFSSFEKYHEERALKYEFMGISAECWTISRNKNWVNHILDNQNTFNNSLVVVGAGHLFGKDNFLFLLQQNGFEVKNIPL